MNSIGGLSSHSLTKVMQCPLRVAVWLDNYHDDSRLTRWVLHVTVEDLKSYELRQTTSPVVFFAMSSSSLPTVGTLRS
jgi:hypothetical protein